MSKSEKHKYIPVNDFVRIAFPEDEIKYKHTMSGPGMAFCWFCIMGGAVTVFAWALLYFGVVEW